MIQWATHSQKDTRALLYAGAFVVVIVLIWIFVYRPLYSQRQDTPTDVGQTSLPRPADFISKANQAQKNFVAPVEGLFTPQNQ